MAEQSQKRLVLCTGDKGGTGKSTFARGLLDVYRDRGINTIAYDCDKRNSQLYRHYNGIEPGVNQLDIFTRGGADALLDDLEAKSPQVSLADLPAQSGEAFEKLEAELGLFADAASLGYRPTAISVISRVKDSVNALRLLMQYCGDRVDYIVVKNLYWGDEDKFSRYDDSKTRKEFLERGGVELVMADLYDGTYDFIDEKNLTFREAAKSSELTRTNRSRVFSWLTRLEAEIDKASPLLGLQAGGEG